MKKIVWLSLEKLKRYPKMKRYAAGRRVRIYSGQWLSYWRAEGAGYTGNASDAGIYDFEDAWNRSSHCGPEKSIRYEVLT